MGGWNFNWENACIRVASRHVCILWERVTGNQTWNIRSGEQLLTFKLKIFGWINLNYVTIPLKRREEEHTRYQRDAESDRSTELDVGPCGGAVEVDGGVWWDQPAANPIFVQRILIFKWESLQALISGTDVSWWAFKDDYICELWPDCALALSKCSQHARSARVWVHISAFVSHQIVFSLRCCSKAVLIFLLKNVYVLTSWWL